MDQRSLITEYETILRNPRLNKMAKCYFDKKSDSENEKNAAMVIRYAIDNILHLTISEAKTFLTLETLEKLKLKQCIEYIKFPSGMNEEYRILYILSKCYPTKVKFNAKKWIYSIYKKVLDQKMASGKRDPFPKGFFTGEFGYYAACVCLNYYISRVHPELTVEELYEMFGNDKIIKAEMRKYQLQIPFSDLFDKDGLKYLHYTLGAAQQNETLFRFYKFRIEYERTKKELADKER